MLGTIKFVDKSINDISVHRFYHCDIIALCSEFQCPHWCAAQRSWTPNWVQVIYSSLFGIKNKAIHGLNSWRHMHQIQQVSLCPSFSTIRAIAFIEVQGVVGWQCSLDFQKQDGRDSGSVRAMQYWDPEFASRILGAMTQSCYIGYRAIRKCVIRGPYWIMAGRAFVVAKKVFHHRNGYILTLWEWLNEGKHFFVFKFNYINEHLCMEKNFNHLKLRYTDPCNFLTKCALVYGPCMIVPHKWTKVCWLATAN